MDVRERVDPAYRELVEAAAAAAVDPEEWFTRAAEIRAERAELMPPPPVAAGVDCSDHEAPGPEGALPVTVRVYRKSGATETQPAVYWIHGGGYIAGTYDMSNDMCSDWAADLGATVFSPDYRLAPEHAYPAGVEDCYAGLKWVVDHAEELGVDPARVIIGGGSAGGGLAAALALLVRDRGEFSVTHQVLIYPMVDDTRTTASSQWTTWGWSPESNHVGWKAYLGELFETDSIPAYAAPTRATDLSGLPPAYISVGTLDIFLDEDLEYARRLIEAGVPTELKVYPGGPHGFDSPRMNQNAELGQRAAADRKDYVRRAIASTA